MTIVSQGMTGHDQGIADVNVEAIRAALVAERTRADQLAEALVTNRRIGIAVGLVMAGSQQDDGHAFEALRRLSMNLNRKLAEVAEDVIYLRHLPTTGQPTSAS